MTQQLHVAGLPRVTEDGYFDAANANKSWVRVHGGQSSRASFQFELHRLKVPKLKHFLKGKRIPYTEKRTEEFVLLDERTES